MENGMEAKFLYGIWKMPEWNLRFQEWNGRQFSILPCQFHTRFRTRHLQKMYSRLVITKNMWKRLAANHLQQINRVIRS